MSSEGVDEVEEQQLESRRTPNLPKTCWRLEDLTLVEPIKDTFQKSKFRIVDISPKYNEISLVSVDVIDEEMFHLDEQIHEVVEDSEAGLGRIPTIKEIVLAPKDMSELTRKKSTEYHRAIIVKVYPKKMVVDVYFFDVGGFQQVSFQELKCVNEEIMKYPVLGYFVILQDVQGENKLTLKSFYNNLIRSLLSTDFDVQLGKRTTTGAVFTEKYKVILSTKSGKQQVLLSDQIQQLQIWEWERFSKGRGNDDEICTRGDFGARMRTSSEDIVVEPIQLPVGKNFSAQVSQILRDDENSSRSCLYLVFINLPLVQNFFDVLHAQMERYCTKIERSNYYPAIEELLMFKLVKNEVYVELGVKSLGRWCRGARAHEGVIYLVDTDDYIPFINIPSEDYEMRRMYAEFNTIPILTARVHPQENGEYVTFEKAQTIFERNKRYSFKITRWREDGDYDVNFNPTKIPEKD